MIRQLIDSYKDYLKAYYPEHYNRFLFRESNGNCISGFEGSTLSEAVVFSILKNHGYTVEILEDISEGGADFRCSNGTINFVVEATHITIPAVERQSGVPHLPQNGQVFSFAFITRKIISVAKKKAKQLAKYDSPRLLFICSLANQAYFLFDEFAAEDAMCGPINRLIALTNNCLFDNQLIENQNDECLFIKLNRGMNKIDIERVSISAVILCAISNKDSSLIGMLHPAPIKEFSINPFMSIPFIKIKKWPSSKNSIETEWVNGSCTAVSVPHKIII